MCHSCVSSSPGSFVPAVGFGVGKVGTLGYFQHCRFCENDNINTSLYIAPLYVIPAKAGIQFFPGFLLTQECPRALSPGGAKGTVGLSLGGERWAGFPRARE